MIETYQCSVHSKRILFQTIYALSPKIYHNVSQNFWGYNVHILQKYVAEQAPDVPIINCSEYVISNGAKLWLDQQ